MKRRKKSASAKLKEELEALQKKYVIALYGNDCYTCLQKNVQGMNCQLGHVPWPRSILSTRAKFDTRYTRIQCYACNLNRGGMGAKALERMNREGIDTDALWEESERQKGKTVPISWYDEQIALYTQALLDLENKHG